MLDSVEVRAMPVVLTNKCIDIPLYSPINLMCTEDLTYKKQVANSFDGPASWKRKEKEYPCIPDPLWNQPELNGMMRAVLLDWMMEVLSEFSLTRETFHLAVSYVDSYLSREKVDRSRFQLLGLAAMFTAGKAENVRTPPLAEFLKSAENAYSAMDLREMELDLCRTLRWKLCPVTANIWMDYLMKEWDAYINKVSLVTKIDSCLTFREAKDPAYRRFRLTFQILDTSMLHWNAGNFLPSQLAGAVFGLMVIRFAGEAQFLGTLEVQMHTTCRMLENFLASIVGPVDQLEPAIAFAMNFLEFPDTFQLPPLCSKAIEREFKDILTVQPYNSATLDFISNLLDNDP